LGRNQGEGLGGGGGALPDQVKKPPFEKGADRHNRKTEVVKKKGRTTGGLSLGWEKKKLEMNRITSNHQI